MVAVVILSVAVALAGCRDTNETRRLDTAAEQDSMPNPSAVKCLEDGYAIEPVLTHGVPTMSYCVDHKSGQKCESWAYFRGVCGLP